MKYAILALVAALAGCNPRTSDNGGSNDLVLYVDRVTGCHYLATGNTYSLTPRMGADGKQICRKGEK